MKNKLVIVLISVALAALLTFKMFSLARVECSLCLHFEGREQCSKALGPDEESATHEAHQNACAILAQGVTETVACGRTPAEDLQCRKPESQ